MRRSSIPSKHKTLLQRQKIMHPILQFTKEINDSCGNLILALIALWALLYAKREYRVKNCPVFRTELSLTDINDVVLTLLLENMGQAPIRIEFDEFRRVDFEGDAKIPVKEVPILLPGNKTSFLVKGWTRDAVTRMENDHVNDNKSGDSLFYLNIRSVSILDERKEYRVVHHSKTAFRKGSKATASTLLYKPKFS